MKSNRNLLAIALLGAALASGCTHLEDKSAGAIVDDSVITTKVKAKFVEDPMVRSMNIKVDTYRGIVQLSGFANSRSEADRAAEIARETRGVKSVKNDIRLAASQ